MPKTWDLRQIIWYLEHQAAAAAHILQFRSTNVSEYFETVEYELQRPLGVRDILWSVPNLMLLPYLPTGSNPLASPKMVDAIEFGPFINFVRSDWPPIFFLALVVIYILWENTKNIWFGVETVENNF